MRVLCVEDEADLREDIVEYLKLQSYDVDQAEDGDTAIDRLHRQHYDAVVCDVRMPKMDGYELLSKVRSEQRLLRTPFIFLTAFGGKDETKRAHLAGCDHFLTKPVDFSLLSDILKSNVNLQRARQEVAAEETHSLASHVVHAVSESLHRPMAEAISMLEHLRESKSLGSLNALEQTLLKLEHQLDAHMQELFLLTGAIQLQIENGAALAREPMTAKQVSSLLSKKPELDIPVKSDEPTAMLDRTLLKRALSHLTANLPNAIKNDQPIHVKFTDDEVEILVCDKQHMAQGGEFVPLTESANLALVSQATSNRIIPLMFAMQVAHSHHGRLAVKAEGQDLAVRITLPRMRDR